MCRLFSHLYVLFAIFFATQSFLLQPRERLTYWETCCIRTNAVSLRMQYTYTFTGTYRDMHAVHRPLRYKRLRGGKHLPFFVPLLSSCKGIEENQKDASTQLFRASIQLGSHIFVRGNMRTHHKNMYRDTEDIFYLLLQRQIIIRKRWDKMNFYITFLSLKNSLACLKYSTDGNVTRVL